MLYRQSRWQYKYSWQQAPKWQQWKIFASCRTLVEAKMLRQLPSRVVQCCPMCHHCFSVSGKDVRLISPPPIYWNNNQSLLMTNTVSCSLVVDVSHKPLLPLFYSIFQCSSLVSVDLSSPLVRVVKYRPILSLSWEKSEMEKEREREGAGGGKTRVWGNGPEG